MREQGEVLAAIRKVLAAIGKVLAAIRRGSKKGQKDIRLIELVEIRHLNL